jgi:hypothetical protein
MIAGVICGALLIVTLVVMLVTPAAGTGHDFRP